MITEAKREYNRAYYLAHRAEALERQRLYNAAHPYRGMSDEKLARHSRVQTEQRRRHPVHYRAMDAFHRAVKLGIVKRGPCATCGNPRAEGHHHNGYEPENWLVVTWLCTKHHHEAHRLDIASLEVA